MYDFHKFLPMTMDETLSTLNPPPHTHTPNGVETEELLTQQTQSNYKQKLAKISKRLRGGKLENKKTPRIICT